MCKLLKSIEQNNCSIKNEIDWNFNLPNPHGKLEEKACLLFFLDIFRIKHAIDGFIEHRVEVFPCFSRTFHILNGLDLLGHFQSLLITTLTFKAVKNGKVGWLLKIRLKISICDFKNFWIVMPLPQWKWLAFRHSLSTFPTSFDRLSDPIWCRPE